MASLPTPPSVAIVITPSHNRTTYTSDEDLSFRHVRHYLGRYDKYVLMPASHHAIYPGLIPKRFPDRYFRSACAHESLLLSEQFYRAFLDYEFILTYNLDALVFSDRLDEWCRAGYDYIGAPWLISPDTPHITAYKVGSGGFSLRRVSSFLRVLASRRYFVEPGEYWRKYAARTGRFTRLLNTPRKFLKRLVPFNGVRWHVRSALHGNVHEDRFWAEYATHYDPDFRIAPVEVAMRFAFEAEPRKCFERIGGQMPFGAHRWQKFDRSFYTPSLLRHGLGSEVRLRSSREARAWAEFESDVARMKRPVSGVAHSQPPATDFPPPKQYCDPRPYL
jgi:hypothetical protein